MKKILYVAPHLSTGGLPQYLVKTIESIKDNFEIYLIEWGDCTGGKLVVQKNRLLSLVDSGKFFTLGENKSEILDIINKIKPDIIHMEEIPEFFMDHNIAKKIYDNSRSYFIVETSHDSSFDVNTKLFYPDKFIFVSEWQVQQYKDIDIPKQVIYYPIEYQERPNREEALLKLGLDPTKKHILHVGLFTPRKNQAEFFEYAKNFPEIQFHCVGNQADNFRYYWEPLMKDKPENITWWNERTDVDNFYKSMDLFLFTSRGTDQDKETMPLVIREALSWDMKLLIYDLPVYLGYFDQFNNIDYLDFEDKEKNIQIIKGVLGLENIKYEKPLNIKPEEEVFIISTYPITQASINTTKECIESVRNIGRKIILTSHIPVPKELEELVDYVINDNNNIITKHTFYTNSWIQTSEYKAHVNLRGENNDVYHGPACYSNYYNGLALAQGLGFKKAYFLNYDYIIKDDSYINKISGILNHKEAFFGRNKGLEGEQITTWFLGTNPEFFIKNVPRIKNAQDYDKLMDLWGAESNGLENLLYHKFKNKTNIYFESKGEFDINCDLTFIHKDYSRVEYFTVLPCNFSNHFASFIQISNNNDSRLIKYNLRKNGDLIKYEKHKITGKYTFADIIKYSLEDNFEIVWDVFDLDTNVFIESHKITIDKTYIENNLNKNGLLEWFGDTSCFYNKPKIKLIHLVTEPEINEKEIESVMSLRVFCEDLGIEYNQQINKIWKTLPPKSTCNRPEDIAKEPGFMKLSPGHYGCYIAHKNAILQENNIEYDFILIFEGDVIIDYSWDDLYKALYRFNSIAKEQDLDLIGFGNSIEGKVIDGPKIQDVYTDVYPFVPAQSYLIPNSKIEKLQNIFKTSKWDAFDLWLHNVANLKMGIADQIYTKHLPGYSLVDKKIKNADNDNPLIFVK